MSTTLAKEVFGVKQFLGDPLDQYPSVRQIVNELEAEYQHMTNLVNNKGQSQHVAETVITTAANQRQYDLSLNPQDFYKALSITSIPDDAVVVDPGGGVQPTFSVSSGQGSVTSLEFTELEHINDDWPYVAQNQGQLFGSSADSQLFAVYKMILPSVGEVLKFEMRPTPTKVQKYSLLYQITDWWDRIFQPATYAGSGMIQGGNGLSAKMPHSSQRMLIRSQVALNLVNRGVVKWSFNNRENYTRGSIITKGLMDQTSRYAKAFEDYLDGMDQGDITYIELWSDSYV